MVAVGEAMGLYVDRQETEASWAVVETGETVRVAGLVASQSVEVRQGEGRSEVGT